MDIKVIPQTNELQDAKEIVGISNDLSYYATKKENTKIYKQMLNLVTNSAKPETQIKLKEIKLKLKNKKLVDFYSDENKKIKLNQSELKKLLPNSSFENIGLLNWLGISKFSKEEKEDKNYSILINKFMENFTSIVLHELDFEEKVNFTFNMYDSESKGVVTRKEVENLLENFNDYNSLNFDYETMKNIVNILLEKLDPNNAGQITKENFEVFLRDHQSKPLTFNPFVRERTFSLVMPDIISINKTNTSSELQINNQNTEALITKSKKVGRCASFCKLHIKNILWLIFYIFTNLLVSFGSFYIWWNQNFLPIPFARFFAGLIMLNCAYLLIFMCENFITLLGNSRMGKIFPIEDTKMYHTICATVFTVAGIGHSVVHLSWTLPYISSFTDVKELNKIMKKQLDEVPSYFSLVFESIPGITGLVLLFFTMCMACTAIPLIRKHSYELFYFIHKFYYLVIALIGVHGMLHLVVTQTYWMFISLPSAVYLVEIIIKIKRFFQYKTKIRSIKFLESGVVQIILEKPKGFDYHPGHYARLQIPEISLWQWHPFTIASSPEQDCLIFYISAVGWWTKQVEKIGKISNPVQRKYDCNFEKKRNENKSQTRSDLPLIEKEITEIMKNPYCRIDGPFGAPAQGYNNHKHLILIASGIGATPFSSILFDILNKLNRNYQGCKIVSLDFYWVIKSYVSSSWLVDLFKELLKHSKSSAVKIHLIFTCSQQKYDLRSFFLWHGLELLKKEKGEVVSDYCGNIYWGRPKWNILFQKKKIHYENENCKTQVGVFVCGNYDLSHDVYKACRDNSGNGVLFEFNMEHF